ncbi:MAG: MFS transporter [Planctomycetes bacterium]|nr:MFS transporter [Planctomycetota bacterium]
MSPLGTSARPRRAARLASDLRAVWVDGLLWAFMVGMGEQSIPPFAVALGLPGAWAGLVATVPMVIGATLQLASPVLIRRLRSHRRWVVLTAAIQALTFLPLAAAALAGAMPGWLLYAVAAVYWGAGIATNPAWSTWVGTLVPGAVRTRYFARRNLWIHVCQIAALVSAGWILLVGSSWQNPLAAFAIVFGFACVARLLSALCLAAHSEPDPLPGGLRDVPVRDFLARFRHGADGRLLVYVLAVQSATFVAAPFYMPHMLRELSFDYAQALGLVAAAVVAKAAALPLHGRIAERRGVGALLWIGGLGVGPSVALWLVLDDFRALLAAQVCAGFVWSAWELGTFLSFFHSIRPAERTSVLTKYHCAHALAIAGGSAAGGALFGAAGGGTRGFLAVAAASTVLRLATLPLLARAAPLSGARGPAGGAQVARLRLPTRARIGRSGPA